MHVSLLIRTCVLTRSSVCPYSNLHVSLSLRYFLKQKNYQPFFEFKFTDYQQRVRVVRTYNVRFPDLSSVLPDEPEWSAQDEQDEVIQNATAATSTVSSAARKNDTHGPPMEWDDDLNEFVEVYH